MFYSKTIRPAVTAHATRAVAVIGVAGALILSATSFAEATPHCGGNNQPVCKKWEQLRGCDPGFHRTSPIGGKCTRDNKLIPDKLEEKLTEFYEPSETDCGGNNQRVCKKSEQLRGCDPGFHRTSPIGGTCTTDNKFVPDKLEAQGNFKREVRALAGEAAAMTLSHQELLKDIVKCMRKGNRNRRFKKAVEAPDIEAAVAVAYECVDADKARRLRQAPLSLSAGIGTSPALRTLSQGGGLNTLSIGVGGGGGVGVLFAGLARNGDAGVVFDLTGNAAPRFYSSGAKAAGIGVALNVGADIIVGVSNDAVQASRSTGLSVAVSGKILAGAGLSVDFDATRLGHWRYRDVSFSGISIAGGVGVGGELGMMTDTSSRIH